MVDVISLVIHDFLKRFKTPSSNKISQLFAITKKKEAIKLCKELTIRHGDLIGIITGCELIGYNHISRFFNSNVDHLWQNLNRDESADNICKMYNQLTKESKTSCFHLFTHKDNPRIWHLFFFETTEISGRSRFTEGSHVHFTSYLWGFDLKTIIDAFPTRPKSSAHIKTREANKAAHTTPDPP